MGDLRDKIAKIIDRIGMWEGTYYDVPEEVVDDILAIPALVEMQKKAERWDEYQKFLCPIGSGGTINKGDGNE